MMRAPQPRPKPPPATEVPVVCRLCGTRMHAPLEKIGQTIQCPDCHTVNDIVGPKQRPAAKPPGPTLDDAPQYGMSETSARPAYRPLVVPRGEYAELAEFDPANRPAGWTEPRGAAATAIAPAEPVEADDDLQIAPPVERLEVKPEIKPLPPPDPEQSLYDGRYDDGAIGDRVDLSAPDAWKRAPLRIGILGFLVQTGTIPRLVLYSIGLTLLVNLSQMAMRASSNPEPSAQVAAIFLFMASSVSMGFFAVSLAAVLLAIVQDTANGMEVVENWPDWNVFEWIATSIYFPAAAFAAALPGGAFALLVMSLGVDPQIGAFAAFAPLVLSWIGLFPVVLYSMLAENSILAPYSAATSKSFRAAGDGWLYFYAYAIFIGLLGGAAMAMTNSRYFLINATGATCIVVLLWLFCRLLGRLMWYAAEKVARYDRMHADD
jgi:hypothetical protein